MRVLIYSGRFFPDSGGVETIVLELARGLGRWNSSHPVLDPVEVTVVTRTRERTNQDRSQAFRLIRDPGLWQFVRLLRDAQIVHVAGPALLPLLLALFLGKPIVLEHHGFQAACPNGLLVFEPAQAVCPGHFMARRYGKCLECNRSKEGLLKSVYWLLGTHIRRVLSNRVKVNVTPTDWLATLLKLRRMTTIYHGISPTPECASANGTAGFAYQGRLVSAKGIGVLLDAFEQLRREGRNLRLKIIGEGPERKSLESRAAASGNAVQFLGHVPGERLNESLADVGTVVMPSLGGEVFGLVAIENMIRGKLLIVSDIGALREVVGDTGMSFPTGDSAALGACMRRVLDEPPPAASLGSAARIRAIKLFDSDGMVKNHVALYREALRT